MNNKIYKLLFYSCLISNSLLVSGQNFLFSTESTLKMRKEMEDIFKPKKLVFCDHIFDAYFPRFGDHILVQIRNFEEGRFSIKGKECFFDPFEKKELWSKKLNFQKTEITFLDSILFLNGQNKCSRLNPKTGKEIWTRDGNSHFLYTPQNAVIFKIQVSGDFQNLKLRAYNLQNGRDIWEKKLQSKEGFSSLKKLDDHHMVSVGNGFQVTSLDDQKTWGHQLESSDKDYSATAGKVAGALVLGVLTGGVMVGNYVDIIYGMHSNLHLSGAHFYMAGKNELIKVDKKDGFLTWSVPLKKEEMSKSIIFHQENHLLMLNLGKAYRYGNSIKMGKPFLAAYDDETGLEIFKTPIPENLGSIIDVQIDSTQGLYVLFAKNILKYDLKTGEEMARFHLQKNKVNNLVEFDNNKYFQKTDSLHLAPLFPSDSIIAIRCENGSRLFFNQMLDSISETKTNARNVFKQGFSNSYKHQINFFTNGKNLIIATKRNKILVEMEEIRNYYIWKNHLWAISKNFLYDLDVSSMVEKE